MKNFFFFIAGLVLVLGIALGIFYAMAPAQAQTGTSKVGPNVRTRQFSTSLVMLKAGEREIHRWIPSTFAANVGDTIVLRVRNDDVDCAEESPHGFSMAAFDINFEEIPAGSEKVVTLNVDKPGVYTFYCGKEGCAKDHNEQLGQIVVLER